MPTVTTQLPAPPVAAMKDLPIEVQRYLLALDKIVRELVAAS